MMLLEHIGRNSGQPRYAVLEILERAGRDRLLVASGFGTRAQWYRNVCAIPDCRVSTGFAHRRPAHVRTLTSSDADAVFDRYRRKHPVSYRAFAGAIAELNDGGTHSVPVVEFTLR